jgi:hypothetical protein
MGSAQINGEQTADQYQDQGSQQSERSGWISGGCPVRPNHTNNNRGALRKRSTPGIPHDITQCQKDNSNKQQAIKEYSFINISQSPLCHNLNAHYYWQYYNVTVTTMVV